MLSKSKVKYIQSLSHKKQRDEDSVFVAEGPKIINELLAANGPGLIELFGLPASLKTLPGNVSNCFETDLQTLEKISFLSTPNQMLGIFRKPAPDPLQLAGRISIMLDNIQDPGNLGSIVRCADWFGIKQIVCSKDCADVYGPKTIQSTMGSVARVNVFYEDLGSVLAGIPSEFVYAATLAGKDIHEAKVLSEGVVIIGNESKGISSGILALAGNRITIPRRGSAESLNAAVATGIILSHLVG